MKWLILRGLVREQRHWGQFREILKASLKEVDPSAEVFALDAPGFGTENERRSPRSVPAIVEDLRTRFLKLKEANPGEWNILAISLGGMIALRWCANHPEDFKRLVLINSSLKGLSPLHHRMKPANYSRVLSLLINSDIAARERKILEMTSNLKGELLDQRAKMHAGFAKPVRKIDALSQIIAAATFQVPKEVKVPMLILGAKGDQLVDSSCSERIAEHYRAKCIMHPHANHDLSTDDPEWIATQVKSWITRS